MYLDTYTYLYNAIYLYAISLILWLNNKKKIDFLCSIIHS